MITVAKVTANSKTCKIDAAQKSRTAGLPKKWAVGFGAIVSVIVAAFAVACVLASNALKSGVNPSSLAVDTASSGCEAWIQAAREDFRASAE